MTSQTRGERDNNPGNITLSGSFQWYGEVRPSKDARFATFDTTENGIRAIARLLKGYYTRNGLKTLRGVISRFAPGHENPTDHYIAEVAKHCGVDPDAEIKLLDLDTMKKVVEGIIIFENGRNVYEASVIENGVIRGLA